MNFFLGLLGFIALAMLIRLALLVKTLTVSLLELKKTRSILRLLKSGLVYNYFYIS